MHAAVLAVIFCGFISLLIGRETINIPEIFSGVHGYTGMTVRTTSILFRKQPKKITNSERMKTVPISSFSINLLVFYHK